MAIDETDTASYHYDPTTKKCTVRGVSELPERMFEIADDIEILDASFGRRSSLPDRLSELRNLRVAFFSNNNFTSIPEVLSSCNSMELVGFKSCKINRLDPAALPVGLRGLILTDNQIPEIPGSIERLSSLQKLMLTGNRLTSVPHNLLACRNLQLLRLSINQLSASPDILFQLPKLAWYSDSRNAFPTSGPELAQVTTYAWQDLEVEQVIGQSSKNVVYAATLSGRQVAVKLFGAGVTTDGDPSDDMTASLAAGEHPHVIGGIGRVTGGPDGRQGFVMPRIAPEYHKLGHQPDFTTLTRDVFPAGTKFEAEEVAEIAADMAAAMAHLSSRGIMHGDLYAHNILSRRDGKSYLGDFGAASLYKPGSISGLRREKVDVRGFGYLLDDLLAQSTAPATNDLVALRDGCLADDLAGRPTFREIEALLS